MNEINTGSSVQYTPQSTVPAQAPQVPQEQAQVPTDQVSIGKPEKSLARKVIEFPGKVIGAAVGAVVGTASAPLHAFPGAVKGAQEGVTASKGHKTEGAFHAALWLQNLAIGAGGGFMIGGPVGAAIGAGGAVALSAVNEFVGEKSKAYDQMVEYVEKRVDDAVKDNEGPKIKVNVQNATEGAIIGGGAATKVGWKVGYEAGDGIVKGTFGAVEGLAEGVFEAGKSVVKDAFKKDVKPEAAPAAVPRIAPGA